MSVDGAAVSYEALAWAILVIGYFLAVAGTLLPGLPGALFVVVGVLGHAYLRPETFSWVSISLIIFLALLSWLVDFLAGVWGAKLGGASRAGLYGAALGGFVGIFLGLPGMIIGPFFGAIIGDLYAKRTDLIQLLRSGSGAALGFVISLFTRFALLFAMGLVILFAVLF